MLEYLPDFQLATIVTTEDLDSMDCSAGSNTVTHVDNRYGQTYQITLPAPTIATRYRDDYDDHDDNSGFPYRYDPTRHRFWYVLCSNGLEYEVDPYRLIVTLLPEPLNLAPYILESLPWGLTTEGVFAN
jgi:hypothetical protein